MIEFIKHLFGFCNEGHFTIWHFFGGFGGGILVIKSYWTLLITKLHLIWTRIYKFIIHLHSKIYNK